MDIRKLVKSGNSSLVVAIPKAWIDRNALKQGSHIYVQDVGKTLIIRPEFKAEAPKRDTAVISADQEEALFVLHEITKAYLDNYYYITVKGKQLGRMAKEIRNHIHNLVALELIEETSDKIVASTFLDMREINILSLAQRIDNIIRSMLHDTLEVITTGTGAQQVLDRDEEVNRLVLLVLKVLKNANESATLREDLHLTGNAIIRYWTLHWRLEKIGDRVKRIAQLLETLTTRERANPGLRAILQEIHAFYEDGMKVVYRMDTRLADVASKRKTAIFSRIDHYLKGTTNQTGVQIVLHAHSMVIDINDLCKDVRYLS